MSVGASGPGEAGDAQSPPATPQATAGDAVAAVVVEEIFLEGDSMTMLRHEAGSTHAVDLLEAADLPAPGPAAPKRP